MKDPNIPDPSVYTNLGFYSSAFRIKKLLRRRGWQDVIPMGGKIDAPMPTPLFKKWAKFQERKKMITKTNGGREFERFVAQIILQHYCNPTTYSNKILDLSPGGDFDILTELPGESLVHFEVKTTLEKTKKSVNIPSIWNFMIRELALSPDMSVFLYDSNQKLDEFLIPIFEILYSLAKYLKDKIETPENIKIDQWTEGIKKSSFTKIHSKIGKNEIYYLYWPVLVIAGGDKIKNNIGDAISLYFGAIKYISPYVPLSRRPTREVFINLPHWKDLPKEVKTETLRRNIPKWVENSK